MKTKDVGEHKKSVFDSIAHNYDAVFTHSLNGTHQRKRFYRLMSQYLNKITSANESGNKRLTILEINCGTGEDAKWLASGGHQVIATDASLSMIEIATSKNVENPLVTCHQCSFEELKSNHSNLQYDILLSNFGGLNCVSSEILRKLFVDFHSLIKPGGHAIIVVMPPIYIWDWIYFGLRGRFKEAKRRMKKAEIRLNDQIQTTYYYNKQDIKVLSTGYFELEKAAAIGQLIPAHYLDKKLSGLFPLLSRAERVISPLLPSDWSDHTYYELQRL